MACQAEDGGYQEGEILPGNAGESECQFFCQFFLRQRSQCFIGYRNRTLMVAAEDLLNVSSEEAVAAEGVGNNPDLGREQLEMCASWRESCLKPAIRDQRWPRSAPGHGPLSSGWTRRTPGSCTHHCSRSAPDSKRKTTQEHESKYTSSSCFSCS